MLQTLKKFFNFCGEDNRKLFTAAIWLGVLSAICTAMRIPAAYIVIVALLENNVTTTTLWSIRKLKNGEIRVIFSVDMFNEGVDIASLDMVMFLRPTESPVVFLQQLGRGLRIYKGKEYLNVLDFIGNYEKAGKAPLLLSGEQLFSKKGSCEYQDLEYPDDCIVDFDMRLIDLFKEMDKKKLTLKMQIRQEYYRVKELLDGKRPSTTYN